MSNKHSICFLAQGSVGTLIPIIKHVFNSNITPNNTDTAANVYFISLDNINAFITLTYFIYLLQSK